MSFQPDAVVLTPFMKTLCDDSQIVFPEEFTWNMDKEQLRELQQSPPNRMVWSVEFVFELSGAEEVVFCI